MLCGIAIVLWYCYGVALRDLASVLRGVVVLLLWCVTLLFDCVDIVLRGITIVLLLYCMFCVPPWRRTHSAAMRDIAFVVC